MKDYSDRLLAGRRPMNQRSAIRIGVIADTHGLFDPAIRRHFRGVDHILHAGDIGDRSVIEQLEQIAPVTAVSGNVDDDEQSVFPSEAVIELAGRRIAIRHILYEGGKLTKDGRAFLDREPSRTSASLVIRINRKPNGSARRCSSILGPPVLSGSHSHAGSGF